MQEAIEWHLPPDQLAVLRAAEVSERGLLLNWVERLQAEHGGAA